MRRRRRVPSLRRDVELANPKHYYTPSWSPDSKKILFTDTDLKVWVVDVATGTAKTAGSDPWMVPQRQVFDQHPGHWRALVPADRVDAIVHLHPTQCRHGAHRLQTDDDRGAPRRHQVTELPPIAAHITEYQCHQSARDRNGAPHICV